MQKNAFVNPVITYLPNDIMQESLVLSLMFPKFNILILDRLNLYSTKHHYLSFDNSLKHTQ